MQPDHMDLARKIRHFFATVFAQIKLDTRDGLTDLSKSQEKALLPIINEIYSKKFKDMNETNANYPGIDYGNFDDELGLQMTITVSKQKVQETVAKITKYDKERKIKEVWMFFLIVDAIPRNIRINTEDIKVKYMTLDDLSDEVINASLDYQKTFLSLIESQYSRYFRNNTSIDIPENTRVPKDLTMFNDFIETEEWFPDNPNEGYEKIYNFISSFQDCLLSCSYDARKILAYILEVQGIPSDYNSKVKMYLDSLMGRLNITDNNFDEFEYQLELLVASDLVDIENEYQGFDGITIKNRKVVVVSYQTYEPEINLFSVLPKFYVKHYSFKEYLVAIKNANFYLLSDQHSKSKVAKILELHEEAPFKDAPFTFIDLFAGIGGTRLPFQQLGGKCVFSSELDKFAQRTYAANYGEVPSGDITQISAKEIDDHDILISGFPCQAFSQVGFKKGFEDTRGTMFFEIQRILGEKRPKIFLLENVKQLKGHDKGNTLRTIINILTGESDQASDEVPMFLDARDALGKKLNYWVDFRVLSAANFGIPQNRERIFIVGFDKDYFGENFDFEKIFKWPTPTYEPTKVGDILESQKVLDAQEDKYTISDKVWARCKRRQEENKNKENGFGCTLYTADSPYTNILSARYYKDSSEILIDQSHLGKNPRKLTPRECARLQGFPDSFIVDAVSQGQIYKQFGNSVCVKVIEAIAKQLVDVLYYKRAEKNRN